MKTRKRSSAIPGRLRYVGRQLLRAPGRSFLALLVAGALLFGLCYLNHSIASNEAEIQRLYQTVEVSGRIVRGRTSLGVVHSGFLSVDVGDALIESEFVRDCILEILCSGSISSSESGDEIDHANVRVEAVSDLSAYAPIQAGTVAVSFLEGWDEETFLNGRTEPDGTVAYPALLNVNRAKTVEEDGTILLTAANANSTRFPVAGLFVGGTTGVLLPLDGIRAMEIQGGKKPGYFLSRCEFTIDPAKNNQIEDFREWLDALLEEDYEARQKRGERPEETMCYLEDSQLTQSIQPLEKNLSLLRLLYPVTQAVSVLMAAVLALLLLSLRAKEAAILRVLGTPRAETGWVLGLEPLLASFLGAFLGGAAAALILGTLAARSAVWPNFALYMAGSIVGSVLGAVRAVNRKPLELLQVKE